MILPAACALRRVAVFVELAALSAASRCTASPVCLPLNGFVSAAMTLAGLFGLAGARSECACGTSFCRAFLQREINLVVFIQLGIDQGYRWRAGPV